MFCKWCGNAIAPTDRNCRSCGRETPLMADCGGFYNLKTEATTSPTAPTVIRASAPCPVVDKLEGKYNKDRKASRSHHAMTVILLLLTLVLMAVTLISVWVVYSQINELELPAVQQTEDAPQNEKDPELTTESEETEPVEGEDAEEPVVAPHDFRVHVSVSQEPKEVTTSADFGTFAQDVATSMKTEEDGTLVVDFDLEGCTVTLETRTEQTENGETAVYILCTTDMDLFAEQKAEYTVAEGSGTGKWIEGNEGFGLISTDKGKTFLWKASEQEETLPEDFEIVATFNNEDGDMMTVTLKGTLQPE